MYENRIFFHKNYSKPIFYTIIVQFNVHFFPENLIQFGSVEIVYRISTVRIRKVHLKVYRSIKLVGKPHRGTYNGAYLYSYCILCRVYITYCVHI